MCGLSVFGGGSERADSAGGVGAGGLEADAWLSLEWRAVKADSLLIKHSLIQVDPLASLVDGFPLVVSKGRPARI